MGTLADAFVRIRPDMDGFPNELKAKAEMGVGPAGNQVGKKFGGGIMAGIGAVVAAQGVISFFKGAFDEAQEAAKVTRLTEAALKSTGGQAKVTASQISDLAGQLSELSGVDDEVIQSSENVLLTFTKVRNEAGRGNDIFNQGTEAALNLSAALGTDLQAATLLVGKALNDPIGGLTALKKAGIQLTDQQKESIKTMVETGDVMGAQKIILAELTTQFGGAAEAAASPADKARVAWGNFQESVGAKLLPMLNDVLQFGLANQRWLVPLATSVAGLAVVIGTVVAATKAWNAVQSVLGIGLENTASKSKRAAVGIGAALVVTQALGAALHKDLNPQIEALSDSLTQFARTGDLTGEALRVVGSETGDLDRLLNGVANSGFAAFSDGATDFVLGLVGMTSPLDDGKERIGALDTALGDLVRNGHPDAAAAAFERLKQKAQEQGLDVNKLTAAFPEYAAALQLAAKGATGLAAATDDAADKAKSLLDAWDELNGKMLTADEAVLDARKAIDGLKDTFKEGGKSINGMTLASSENRVELERSAQKSVEAAIRYQENGHSADEAAVLLAKFKDEAIKNTGATGKNKDAVKELADQLFRIPENVHSNVAVSFNTSGAAQLNRVLKELEKRGMSDGGVLQSFANGGVARSFAGGGIEQHVAQVVKAGAWRIWGEPETGGEAYIPLALTKRTRSTAILADVARRFGFGLVSEDAAAGVAVAGGGGGASDTNRLLGAVLQSLDALRAAVDRVAGGVGAEINGSVGVMRQLGRAM